MEEFGEKPVGAAIFINQVINGVVPEGGNPTRAASSTDSSPLAFFLERFAYLEEKKVLQLCLLDEKDFRWVQSHNVFQGFFFQTVA